MLAIKLTICLWGQPQTSFPICPLSCRSWRFEVVPRKWKGSLWCKHQQDLPIRVGGNCCSWAVRPWTLSWTKPKSWTTWRLPWLTSWLYHMWGPLHPWHLQLQSQTCCAQQLASAADPEPLPLPALPQSQAAEEECQTGNVTNQAAKSLEDYEKEAKDKITQKKAIALDAAMKKPAAKKPPAQAKAASKSKVAKDQKKHAQKTKHVTPAFLKQIYGCTRCRGNVAGCDVCWSPYFSGKRFSSRAEYNKWYQQKQTNSKKWNHFLLIFWPWQGGLGCLAKSHASDSMHKALLGKETIFWMPAFSQHTHLATWHANKAMVFPCVGSQPSVCTRVSYLSFQFS